MEWAAGGRGACFCCRLFSKLRGFAASREIPCPRRAAGAGEEQRFAHRRGRGSRGGAKPQRWCVVGWAMEWAAGGRWACFAVAFLRNFAALRLSVKLHVLVAPQALVGSSASRTGGEEAHAEARRRGGGKVQRLSAHWRARFLSTDRTDEVRSTEMAQRNVVEQVPKGCPQRVPLGAARSTLHGRRVTRRRRGAGAVVEGGVWRGWGFLRVLWLRTLALFV